MQFIFWMFPICVVGAFAACWIPPDRTIDQDWRAFVRAMRRLTR